jgi:hypothetical protein
MTTPAASAAPHAHGARPQPAVRKVPAAPRSPPWRTMTFYARPGSVCRRGPPLRPAGRSGATTTYRTTQAAGAYTAQQLQEDLAGRGPALGWSPV